MSSLRVISTGVTTPVMNSTRAVGRAATREEADEEIERCADDADEDDDDDPYELLGRVRFPDEAIDQHPQPEEETGQGDEQGETKEEKLGSAETGEKCGRDERDHVGISSDGLMAWRHQSSR